MGKVLRPILQAAIIIGLTPVLGPQGAALAAAAVDAGLDAAGVWGGKLRANLSAFDPKSINPDPATPRKIVLGETTFPVDLRYAEPSGTNQEYVDYIFALAAHKSDAILNIFIEDDLAWSSAGGAQGKYAGYLTVETILEAGPSAYHVVNAGTVWNSTTRLTGCTTMKVRVKRSDNSKNSQSPFASGINGRWAVIGRGMPVYDPARDSTQAGGSGTQRATDNSTWAYTASGVARGNNPALQLLSYLLGWRINNVVSVGVGLPVDTIDIASFATAAALCDESVALAAGGTQRRFEAGRAFSDADDPLAVVKTLLDAMNGELVDDGGRLALRLAVNDLTAAVTLTDDDFVSGYSWKPAAPIEQQYTVVRGRYSQPAAPTLYGMVDYPEVAIPRTSLAPRVLTLELSAVQEQRRAERIAKQAAQRNLYQGTFTVTLGVRGWLLRRNMVVAVTSNARGWTAKLFRVRSLTFNADATVEVVLREENAAIYAWSASESPVVTPVSPVVFDSRAAASWLMAGIEAQANLTAPANANRVPFSRMEGDLGWAVTFNPSSLVVSTDFNDDAGRRYFVAAFTATAAGQDVSIGGTVRFPVRAGERLSLSSAFDVRGAAMATGTWRALIVTYNAAGTPSFPIWKSGTGALLPTVAQQEFFTVPAGAVEAAISINATSGAAGLLQLAIYEPMVASAATGQTVHPVFTPGPNAANGADVTADQPIVSKLDATTGTALDAFGSGTTGLPFTQIVESGEARDGDTVTFASTLPSVPRINFLPGGNAATAGQNIRISADSLSTTGFTMRAKSQSVGSPTTITDTGATAGGTGEPDRVINRTDGAAPFDGIFTYRYTVTVGEIAPGEPGRITIAIFAKKSGAWTEVGRRNHGADGTYDASVTPGTVDFGTGTEFGIDVVSATGTGTQLDSFDSVTYTKSGTLTETSLTPSGASAIPWIALI